MVASLAAVLLLAAGPATCPEPRTVRVVYRDAAWSLDVAGQRSVTDIAAYVRAHPKTEVFLATAYHNRGNVAVVAVSEAFEKEGVVAGGLLIYSGPRGGPNSIPKPPDGYMDVSVDFRCDGAGGGA